MLLFSGVSIGIVNIIVYGFSGAGLPIFCFMGVLAALFLGSRAGYITILICGIPMIIIAVLMSNNTLAVGVDLMEISTLPISWATAIIVMLFLGSITIWIRNSPAEFNPNYKISRMPYRELVWVYP